MTKKIILILAVIAILTISYFCFFRKKEEEVKWDTTQGTWTIAQREACLSFLKEWRDYGLDTAANEWPRSINGAIYAAFTFHDSKRVFIFPFGDSYNEFYRMVKDNGVYDAFKSYRAGEGVEKD